jgi:transcription initiation factor TFIIB
MENHAEWRTFDSENNSGQRVGSPSSLAFHDMGLSTIISKVNKDSAGHNLDASMNYRMQRLRTWDARTRVHAAGYRNLMRAFSELGRLKDKLGLSDAIVQKTAYIYRKAQEKRLARGEATTQKEIAEAAGVTEVTIRTRFKDLKTKDCMSAMMMQETLL